jgi:AcrR family transcriptional regulator
MSLDSRRAIIDQATLLIAEAGVRGASLRKVGSRSGVNFARLAADFGGKDGLIAACFADVVERDVARLRAIVDEHDGMTTGPELAALFLWALCQDAGGPRQNDYLVLTELLLASGRPELSEIFRQWILRRQDILRAMAARAGLDPIAFDILGLIVLMEGGFSISNYNSPAYRLIARASFNEAFVRLTGLGERAYVAALHALAMRYHINADDQPAARAPDGADDAAQGRNQIIEAAAAIIEEQGLDGLTNRAVATRAGVSLALTTYHFRSITELALAGLRRSVENFASRLEPEATRAQQRSTMLAARHTFSDASERDVRLHRGMLQVSLTAARSGRDVHLGHLVRRQVGMAAYAAVDADKRDSITRTSAASYSLWAGAVYLVSPSFPEIGQPFDFNAQANLAGRCLLGIDLALD